jgi:phosphoribosyl 1,2-cyclic phosphodiesterase
VAHHLPHGQLNSGSSPWRVLPFDLRHDTPGTLGFCVEGPSKERLLYVTDTAFIPYRFDGLTIVAIEANYSEAILRESGEATKRKLRALRYHMSLERTLAFLAANDLDGVREIWLLHLSDAHSDEAAFREAVREATGKPVFVAQPARSLACEVEA